MEMVYQSYVRQFSAHGESREYTEWNERLYQRAVRIDF